MPRLGPFSNQHGKLGVLGLCHATADVQYSTQSVKYGLCFCGEMPAEKRLTGKDTKEPLKTAITGDHYSTSKGHVEDRQALRIVILP